MATTMCATQNLSTISMATAKEVYVLATKACKTTKKIGFALFERRGVALASCIYKYAVERMFSCLAMPHA